MNWDYARHALAVLLLLTLGGVLLWSVGFGIYLNQIHSHGWASTRRLLLTLPPAAAVALALSGLFWEDGLVPHWILAYTGNPPAQMIMAQEYLVGSRLLAKNPTQARAWITRAACSGFARAQVVLAGMELEDPTKPDPLSALGWARRAASQGLDEGNLLTGELLLTHPDLAHPGERAQTYFDVALPPLIAQASAGNAQAMFSLGLLKLRGEGLPLDREGGFTLLLKAQGKGITLHQATMIAVIRSTLPPDLIRKASNLAGAPTGP